MERRPIVQSGNAGFPSASCHFRSFRSRRASLYCVAKGKGNLYGYGVRSVPNPRLFCLFTFSFIRPSSCSLAQSVSRSSVGDAKGYRAAISEMETWHFLSLCSLFILSDIPRMRGGRRPEGEGSREGEGRWRGKATKTCLHSYIPRLGRPGRSSCQ